MNNKSLLLAIVTAAFFTASCAKKVYTVMADGALIQNPEEKKPVKVQGGEVKRGENVFLIEEKNFGGKKYMLVQIDKVTTKGWIEAGNVNPGKIASATILRDTDFYSRPSLKSPKSGKAKAGVVVFVLSSDEQFSKVQFPGGEGFIEKGNLGDSNMVIRTVNIPGVGSVVVSASSTYKSTEGKEAEYDVRNVFDGGLKTGWCEGKDDDNGVGETITLSLPHAMRIETVSVVNGLTSSEASYKNNNRVAQMSIEGGDQGKATMTFDDGVYDYQERNLMSEAPIQGSRITFRIEGVHAGRAKDTCISEIKISGSEVTHQGDGGGYTP